MARAQRRIADWLTRLIHMLTYQADAHIHATADTVWEIITDGSAYPEWDSGIAKVEGTIADGQRIKVRSALNPRRSFPVKVGQSGNRRIMTWTGGMPLGLLQGVRTFTVVPDGELTHLRVREEFTGPLLPLAARSMPDLQPSFTQFVNGVKARAEKPRA
jgi:hypothetical protein